MQVMYSKFWPKGGVPGILHHFTDALVAFEFTTSSAAKPHTLLFVGGLGDGVATTSYLSDIVHALTPTKWSIFSLALTSSYQSWGLGYLDRDIDEIARCARYIRDYKTAKFGSGKLVLMGHSTGSQDVLHYLAAPNPLEKIPTFDPQLEHIKRSAVDGAVLQAAVSDREVIDLVLSDKDGFKGHTQLELQAAFDKMKATATEAAQSGRPDDHLLPLELTSMIYPSDTPLSCRRFLSLVSPESPGHPSEDDMFSSDLSNEQLSKTFGMVQKRGLLTGKIMVLSSGADQSVPAWVDKEKLLARWKDATEAGGGVWDLNSAVIPHASHALSNDDQAKPRAELVRRLLAFLNSL